MEERPNPKGNGRKNGERGKRENGEPRKRMMENKEDGMKRKRRWKRRVKVSLDVLVELHENGGFFN